MDSFQSLNERNLSQLLILCSNCSKLRINYGSGYRDYYLQKGTTTMITLLAYGDKGAQGKDIQTALQLAGNLTEESE